MNIRPLQAVAFVLLLGCNFHKAIPEAPKKSADSANTTKAYSTTQASFFSFWGIDSIVKINHTFFDTIDSITIGKSTFEAIYLTSHKGGANITWFDHLKATHQDEYTSISNIHTAHALEINNASFSFNIKSNAHPSKEIPESTKVSVAASVYSLYSKGKRLGRTIIIDSIKGNSKPVQRGVQPD